LEHEQRKLRGERRAPGDIDVRKFLMKKFRKSPLSVPQIADRVGELLGEPVSVSRLYSYTASTKISARLPAYFLPVLCDVLDSDDVLLFFARPRLRKQIELADQLRELRRLCDELLQMPEVKRRSTMVTRHRVSRRRVPGNGIPANEKKNGNGSCAR